MTDSSEREKPKASHQSEHDKFREIFEKSFDAMVIADDDGRYIDANESAADLFGMPKEDLIGRSIDEFAPPDFDFSIAWEAFQASEDERGTFPLVRPDGTERFVEYAATSDIVPGQHLSILRDITERQENEKRLQEEQQFVRSIFRSLPDPLYVADREGYAIRWNEQLESVTGYTSDEIEGMHVTGFIRDDEKKNLIETFRPAIEEGRSVTAETVVETKDGREIPYELTGAPLEDSEGNVRGITGIARNISKRKRREQQLEEFASIVSHDLRNPLNVADGRLQLALEEHPSDHLDHIDRALGRMDALIEDLLTLAQHGEVVSETEPVAIADLAEHCWELVETADATLITEGNRTMLADASRLQQLLENLIRNAIEHAGHEATVTVGELPDGFYLEDDGPGIPPEQKDEVFAAGYSSSEDGTGFGLSIVKQIVDAHEWEIRITESNTGGARFEISDVELISE